MGRKDRSIEDARQLMIEAGYPDGRDAKTGRPLVINYDFYAPPTPERKPEIDWVVRQYAKIDIQLEVRATDNNQFQDKVRKGKHQVFWLGWNADYPDAENFLFLLYGPNSKSVSDGENTANYQNPEYDKLFARLKTLEDGPEKQAVIDKMVRIVQEDAPWSMGFFPYASQAGHPDPRPWALPEAGCRAARRQVGSVEPPGVVAAGRARRAGGPRPAVPEGRAEPARADERTRRDHAHHLRL